MADIVFSDNGAVLIVKWSKMGQDRQHIDTIPIPHLGNAFNCPVKALNLLTHILHVRHDPLFRFQLKVILPLTDSPAGKHLKSACQHLNLARHIISHNFRWGGATWTFRNGVPVEHIQVQGTWSYQCV